MRRSSNVPNKVDHPLNAPPPCKLHIDCSKFFKHDKYFTASNQKHHATSYPKNPEASSFQEEETDGREAKHNSDARAKFFTKLDIKNTCFCRIMSRLKIGCIVIESL